MACEAVDAIVVGAGHAGLVAASAVKASGRDVVVLERGQVAQAWRDRYPELRLITTRHQSRLEKLPWPGGVGRWPARDDVVRYIDAFARLRQLDVRTGVEVRRATWEGDRWVVATAEGRTLVSQDLVVATGRHGTPVVPDHLRDQLRAVCEVVHSASFGAVDVDPDRPVLVVGSGASGVDVARVLAQRGVEIVHFVRHPPHLLPEALLGVAVAPVAARLGRALPAPLLDLGGRLLDRSHGRAWREAAGPSRPISDALERGVLPALDRGYRDHVTAGRIVLVDQLRVAGGQVVVQRHAGRRDIGFRPQLAVLATGYRPDVGFLGPGLADAAGVVQPPAGAARPRSATHLHVIAMQLSPHGQFAAAAEDVALLRRALRDRGSRGGVPSAVPAGPAGRPVATDGGADGGS
jgi:putative flavoprotein involved in K+ transport